MFPSSGYFRGVNCPFYISGLCERPYCHFRHPSRIEDKTSTSNSSLVNKPENGPSYSTPGARQYNHSTAYLTSSYSSTPQPSELARYSTSAPSQPTGPVEVYKTASQPNNEAFPIPTFTGSEQALPESLEEPVARALLPKISGLARPKLSSGGRLPSYVPTPKVHLAVKKDVPAYEPTPKTASAKISSRTIEYDPVKNFAFVEKKISSEDDSDKEAKAGKTKEVSEKESADAEFSDDEADKTNKVVTKSKNAWDDDDLTDSDVDLSNNDSSKPEQIEDRLTALLLPSSHITRKLDSLDKDVSKSLKNGIRKSSDEKRNSDSRSQSLSKPSVEKNGSTVEHSSKSNSSKSCSAKSDSTKHRHPSSSSSTAERRASRSYSSESHSSKSSTSHSSPKGHSSKNISSSSHSSKSHPSKQSSSTKSVSTSKSSTKSTSSSESHKSHNSSSAVKKSASSSSSSSDKSKVSSSKESSSKHNENSRNSEKENHQSSKHKPSSQSKSDQSLDKSNSSTNKSLNSTQKHSDKHKIIKIEPSSSSDSLTTNPDNQHDTKTNKDVRSSSSSNNKKQNSSQNKTKHEGKNIFHSVNKDLKRISSTSETKVDIKKERRDSKDLKHSKRSRSSSGESKPAKKRIKTETSSRSFSQESEGSDSDVQIIDNPPEPPVQVVEVSESDHDDNHNDDDSDDDSFSGLTDDLMSEADTFDECLKIFQESEKQLAAKASKASPDQSKKKEVKKPTENPETMLAFLGKKRMAHIAANQSRVVKTPSSSRPKLNPAEVMHNRIVEMQKRALLRAAAREGRESELPNGLSSPTSGNKSPTKSSSSLSSLLSAADSIISISKKREAHNPTPPKTPTKSSPTIPTSSFYAKPKTKEQTKSTGNSVTIAGTASKTEKRKAHEPTMSNLKRPIIPASFGDKVPTNIRQRYLNLMIDEFLKFTPEEEAFNKGLDEELAVYIRASNKNIYLRLAVNAIKRIRTEAKESQPSSSKSPCAGVSSLSSMAALPSHVAQSHEATLGGSLAARTSYTLHRSSSVTKNLPSSFRGKDLYDRLSKYILTEEQLRANGYPRPAEDGSSKVVFYKEETKDNLLKENERTCRRCGKRYYVAVDGTPATVEKCIYHHGNAYKKKVAGSIDSRYACCNERAGSKGCQVAESHVNERNKTDNLTGYMKTLPGDDHKIYSLDCEMVYTKAGLELARVTVIDEDCNTVYESLVRPDTDIIDYNTRFSGITAADMKGVATNLRGVQAVMLSMISDKTILMGHSLESDLVALKLIHSTVVDTSLVFPHRLGLPYKRALRNLMVELLQKIIQADDGGHDSKEDAVACMQLMLYKVKEDAKRDIRRV
ncbi:RNA exonuclease 1 homolog [Physella acuta]|uniref:RNA exonuclease 1 homolog n=1 Tax=Physella acuta TaxID=109671 RepID=UPI0027DB7FAA|nr:RNA exonuclease 1 homolog [Physella acuta]